MPRRRRRRTYRRRRPTSSHSRRPRRRRRYTAAPRRRRTYRRRRRNAGIAPFTASQNPLILSNPRRRRRRRNPRLNLKRIVERTLVHMGGGAIGYGVNQFGLAMIANDWVRRGAQIATGVAAATFLKGELGASAAGAIYYPLIADLAMYTGLVAVPTEADLHELSADLESALLEADLADDELYIEDGYMADQGDYLYVP